jgi:lysophospholipase L1-like esterase
MSTESWIGAWASGMYAAGGPFPLPFTEGFTNQTVRQTFRLGLGGSAVRLRLSNLFGRDRVRIEAASVGVSGEGGTLAAGTSRPVTFGGERSVWLSIGSDVFSDPVTLAVSAGQELVLSVYLRQASGPPTLGSGAISSFVAAGNAADRDGSDGFAPVESGVFGRPVYFLSAIHVLADGAAQGAVVALGDSITAGGWPGHLADRLAAAKPDNGVSILNVGIAGNRILSNGAGISALARLERDVLLQPGVKAVIFFEGVNDIGFTSPTLGIPLPPSFEKPPITATDLIAGCQQVVARVHAAGWKVFGGTIAPFKGASYWTPEGEAMRQAVNDWIRKGGAYDGVIDFAAALADAGDRLVLAPEYDSGDHLHPSEAGQRRLAEAVDLRLLDL